MKRLLLIFLLSCNLPKPENSINNKIKYIDSLFYAYDPKIVRIQKYVLADTTKIGGIRREYVSIDSNIILIQDKTWYDTSVYYYSAYFIKNQIALIDMRCITHSKLLWVNKGYFDKNKLFHEEIQAKEGGNPSLLLNYFNSAAEIWYPTKGELLQFGKK